MKSEGRNEVKEGDVVKECQKALLDSGWVHWRSQSGSFRAVGGGWFRTGVKGLADICAIIPPDGRLLLVECKTEKGKVSKDQEIFLTAAGEHGAFCVVVKDAGQLRWVIQRLKQNPKLKVSEL